MKLDEYGEKEIQRTLEYSLVIGSALSKVRTAQTTFNLGYYQAMKDVEHFIKLWPIRPEGRLVTGHSLYQRCEVEDFMGELRDKLTDVHSKEKK